ncbi:MAG: SHOCT domain-containing protein [Actinobacteria bacterium]|nr:SHOCT domain-containing protein [Actinomycetota bacterium]
MVLAYDFPLLSALLVVTFFFLWIAWIIVLFRTVVDVFRSQDMSGFAKAFWLLFIIVIPWLGVLIYLIANGDKMAEREVQDVKDRDAAFRSYVRDAAGGGQTAAAELAQLADLRDRGVLSEDEFQSQKAKLIG